MIGPMGEHQVTTIRETPQKGDGVREIDMMEGVRPINPKDVLDAAITAWKEHALVLNTWTM